MKIHTLRALACLPALTLMPGTSLRAVDEIPAKIQSGVADVRGDAAKAALKELDGEIDRVDAMIVNAPTTEEKAAAKARMDVLKERRNELRKTYVQSRYDELVADVRAQGNKFSSWTKRTVTRNPADKAADDVADGTRAAKRDAKRAADEAADEARDAKRAAKRDARKVSDNTYAQVNSTESTLNLASYKARHTDTDKDEAKAAIKALEQNIKELDDHADKMPRGADRDITKRRIKALDDRKDELKKDFNKARFNALIDDVQSEWKNFRG